MEQQVITAVIVDENTVWTRMEICSYLNISEDLFCEVEEQGLLDNCVAKIHSGETCFTGQVISRMEKAFRLHGSLGINLPGVVLALELLDELAVLRHKVAVLER